MIMRVGIPSVWESTAVTIFSSNISCSLFGEVAEQHLAYCLNVQPQRLYRAFLIPLLATLQDLAVFLLTFLSVVHGGKVEAQVPVEVDVQVIDRAQKPWPARWILESLVKLPVHLTPPGE